MKFHLCNYLKCSGKLSLFKQRRYFCNEPWTGILEIKTNQDVVICPCHLKMKIGNLNESTIQEIWNSKGLIKLRKAFKKGKLPKVCEGQLCPPVLGERYNLCEHPQLFSLSHNAS